MPPSNPPSNSWPSPSPGVPELMLPQLGKGIRLMRPSEIELWITASPHGVSHSTFAGRLHESPAFARFAPSAFDEKASSPDGVRRIVSGMVSELFGGSAPMSLIKGVKVQSECVGKLSFVF